MKTVLRKQDGQQTLEAVLLMLTFLGFAMILSRTLTSKQVLASVTRGPWSYIQGMAADGVWRPYPASRANHPNRIYRHLSVRGDTP